MKMSARKKIEFVMVGMATMTLGVGCVAERELEREFDESRFAANVDRVDADGRTAPNPGYAFGGNLVVEEAELVGTIGPVQVNDDRAWADGYTEDAYASVYSVVDEAENGAVMTIVELIGGVDHADFQPGQSHTYRSADFRPSEATAFLNVVGCSGQTSGDWDYDQTASVVEVDVTEGEDPGDVVIDYSAQFENDWGEDSVVSGRFALPRE
jgi:hypothetical protein